MEKCFCGRIKLNVDVIGDKMWHIDITKRHILRSSELGTEARTISILEEIARNLAIIADCLEEANGYNLSEYDPDESSIGGENGK